MNALDRVIELLRSELIDEPRVEQIARKAIRATLETEADWLAEAGRNAARHGYSRHQIDGWNWAAGWVRMHAAHPQNVSLPNDTEGGERVTPR